MLLLGCVVLAVGVYFQVQDNVIVNPGEGVVKVIADKMGKEFGIVKIVFNFVLVLIALVISLFAFGAVRAVREGTIISAFLVGYIIRLVSRLIKSLYKEKKLAS